MGLHIHLWQSNVFTAHNTKTFFQRIHQLCYHYICLTVSNISRLIINMKQPQKNKMLFPHMYTFECVFIHSNLLQFDLSPHRISLEYQTQ